MSENQPTYRRCKEGVLSESQLILQCAHQISRCSVDIPLGPSSMNTPHAIYPIERSCSNLKRKRAAPIRVLRNVPRDRLSYLVSSHLETAPTTAPRRHRAPPARADWLRDRL